MGFLGKLTAAALDVALTPVDIVKDVCTLGGAIVGRDKPYTVQRLQDAVEHVEEAIDDLTE